MSPRPRIDLDGVTLEDPDTPDAAVAIFRFRTTEGVVLLIPESAEITLSWDEVEAVELDLKDGILSLRVTADYARTHNWLRGASVLRGRWTDRFVMSPR